MENFTFREMYVDEKSIGKSQRFFLLSFIISEICYNQQIWLLYGTKHSLVYNLIVYNHYRTFQEILKSHAACWLTLLQVQVCYNFGFYRREILRSRFRANINNSIKLKAVLLPKIKLKQCCRRHLPPSSISMQNSSKLISVA